MQTSKDLDTQISALSRAARRYKAGQNEGGDGYTPYAEQLAQLQADRDSLHAAESDAAYAAAQAAKTAEWTLEVTMVRRQAWNTWVRGNIVKGQLHLGRVADQQVVQGWTAEELKAAVARHAL
jgi:DNA repair ATPase RecN